MNTEAQNHQLKIEIEALHEKIASLKESEERYRLISSVATDYTFSTKVLPDGSLDLNWVAGAFESISGYSVEEFKARGGWRVSIHPEDLQIDDNDIARLRNNQDTESQIRTINRNGEIVWVQVFAHPIWDKDNNCLTGIYGAVKNITDRKNAEEKLIKSESRFRTLIENIHEMVITIDKHGKPTYISPAVERISGFTIDKLRQMDEFALVHPEEIEETKKTLKFLTNHPGIPINRINRLLHKDGHWIWAEGTAINLLNDVNINAIVTNYRDITERIMLEKSLRDNNEQLKLILENSPIAIWDWNIETDRWFATPKYYTMLGYKPESGLPDRTVWLNRIHPDDRDMVAKKIEKILTQETAEYNYEARMLHADGSYRWQSVIGNAIERNKENKPIRMLGIRIDINERKLAEESITNSELQLRNFLEKINLIAIILDRNGKVIFCNDYLLNLSGYSSEEMIGADWFDLMIPKGLPEVKEIFLTSLKNGEILSHFENPIITKDGRIREIVWSNAAQHDSNGLVMGASSIGEDITDQKLAQEEIRSKDKLLYLTGEMAKVGGWEFDTITMKGKWSEEVARIHAIDPDIETNAEFGLKFYADEWLTLIEKAIERAISDQESYDLTLKMTDAKGVKKWVRTRGVPVVIDGEVVKLQGTFQDITELKNAEEELIILNQELEKRVFERTLELENRSKTLEEKEIVLTNTIKNLNLKSEELQSSTMQLKAANKELEAFSYSVSHDLRAPLRAINGFVNIMNEEYSPLLDDEGKRICSIINSNAVKMGQLIDDLLSFSRLIRSELHHSMIDMQGLVNSVIAEFQSSKELNPNIISLNELPKSTGDTNLIKQVWMNLISNAIKYSSKTINPQIIIGAAQYDNETVYFIRDNGVGFNMNYSHKLFGVFQRLHGSNEFEGTGVGLAIVQRIIIRHGGRVWAEGEIGKGATFYFALPQNNTGN